MSVPTNIAEMNSGQLERYAALMEERFKVQLRTLRALARAKNAEERAMAAALPEEGDD